MANYGIPYMGSKNNIAHKIIAKLPKAENFYDLFCGGCSITHVAILSRKYNNIYFNDIDKDMPQLFIDAIHGKYQDERRWISREDFNKLKDDPYIKIVWSFGNKGMDYLYNKEIEPYKRAYWYAVMYGEFKLFRELGINIPNVRGRTYKETRLKIKQWLGKHNNTVNPGLERLQSLERLERLQSLEGLERLQSLEGSALSYEKVEIKENSVIYCDIPYENTAGYLSGDFNHKKFYDWACKQKELVVISSYGISDNRFIRVINFKKRSNLQSGSGKENNEGLFIPKTQLEKWRELNDRKSKPKTPI